MFRWPLGIFTGLGDRLFLNLFAVFGALLGLFNVAMAWCLYGAGSTADLWMMALAATQAFALLSQLGVEQVAVFSAQARAVSNEQGRYFDRQAMAWALWFGIAFGVIVWKSLPLVVSAFASGFDVQTRQQLQAVMAPLMTQLMLAPALHVLRQQLLLDDQPKPAILLNNIFGIVQSLVLLAAWGLNETSPQHAAEALGWGSLVASSIAVLVLREGYRSISLPDWRLLAPFIRASIALRFTHSVHNVLVVVLTSHALSGGVGGTVATFQYVKKVADGLASISIGPHLVVYHAAQARAWMNGDKPRFLMNIRDYLVAAMPLLLLVVTVLMVALYAGDTLLTLPQLQGLISHTTLLMVLMAWQVLIALETIPAGVLVIERKPISLLAVNGLYIAAFFVVVTFLLPQPYSGISVATISLVCQVMSSTAFAFLALHLFKQKFGGGYA